MPRMTEARLEVLEHAANVDGGKWGDPDAIFRELSAEIRACWKERTQKWFLPHRAGKPKARSAKAKGQR